MKISLITVVYNSELTLARCFDSVARQKFPDLEYIVIDGGSTDKTINIIKNYQQMITQFISEPDRGIYDAMNKGIALATGEIIGTLNADDYFSDDSILNSIAEAFGKNNTDTLYGDLDYVDKNGKILRKWRSGLYDFAKLKTGWMPPHPTFYFQRSLFEKFGSYSLNFGTSADYELMSRFLYTQKATACYLEKVMVKMQTGGKSNRDLISRIQALFFDYKAMRQNGIPVPLFAMINKPLQKVKQYF